MADETTATTAQAPAKRDRGRLIVASALGAIAALFALLNLDDVRVHWIFTTTRTALIVVIVISFGLGVAVGALAARRSASRKAQRP